MVKTVNLQRRASRIYNCSVFLHFFDVMLCINNNGSSEILSKVDLYYDYTHSS